jgi:hypothetical protein
LRRYATLRDREVAATEEAPFSSVPAVGATGACPRCARWTGSFNSCVNTSVGSTAAPMPRRVFMTYDIIRSA